MNTWTYGEWRYWPDIDDDIDNKKILHYAVRNRPNEKDMVLLQADPYTWLTESEFQKQVDLQCTSSPFKY